MKSISIGLFGLDFFSTNLGCAALAYAFRSMLERLAEDLNIQINTVVFTKSDVEKWTKSNSAFIKESACIYSFKRMSSIVRMSKEVSSCDLVFDFTEGDSFSDIYGEKRFILGCATKILCEINSKLILGPQTYGPFASTLSRALASHVIRHACRTYSRDEASAILVENLTGRSPRVTTDVAFCLPYEKLNRPNSAGFNISGLLWNGGYNQANQFKLNVNYRAYCESVIDALERMGYTVHVVAHVVGEGSIDQDYDTCVEFCETHPSCILAPRFSDPMEAKSYISSLECFVGARMHATIAAFSAGVPVVPFAYSKKFSGLFGSLGYNYVVDGRTSDTNTAISTTIQYISELDRLRASQSESLKKVERSLSEFYSWLKEDFTALCK